MLLIQEGVRFGAVRALPAAAGVAVVDVLYCALAIAAGAAASPLIESIAPWPTIVGGVALLVMAGRGLAHGLTNQPIAGAAEGAASSPSGGIQNSNLWPRFVVFFGLTVINPATLVYFAAITTGLVQLSFDWRTAALFVTGVGGASFAWQALLASIGGLLRGRTGPRVHAMTALVGNVIVAALGVVLIAQGLR